LAAQAGDPQSRFPTPTQRVDAFRCDGFGCAMPPQGAYPYLIIGYFQVMASASQAKQLIADMQSQHRWPALPNDPVAFYAALQPVTIQLADDSALAVLMTQEEARVELPQPGDLVRYSPHRGKYEIPPTDLKQRTYWAVDGCVSVICRAKDSACFGRYPSGVYRFEDGVQISPQAFQPLPHGAVIDTESLLPRRASESVR